MAWVRVPEGWYDPVTNTLSTAEPGYNPAQYAPKELAEELADYLGGSVTETKVEGPIKPPPQNLVVVGGVELNAGLLAERYANYPREWADAMTRDELALAGVKWTPPPDKDPPVVSTATSVADAQIPGGTTVDVAGGGNVPATPVSQTPVTARTDVTTVTGNGETTVSGAPPSVRELVLAAAGGDGFYTWDEWNWFYQRATGNAGPAPEDCGFTRSSDGLVYINGSARFNYATWEQYALRRAGARPGAPGQQPAPPEQPAAPGYAGKLGDLLLWIIAVIVSGGAAGRIPI